jgi:hypothetical protein
LHMLLNFILKDEFAKVLFLLPKNTSAVAGKYCCHYHNI